MDKRILIIGNGFDLAHGLKTSYKDFLMFEKYIKKIKDKNILYHLEENYFIKDEDLFLKLCNIKDNIELYDTFYSLFNNNIWINYFEKIIIDNGWVDFESEISKVIKNLDKLKKQCDISIASDPLATCFSADTNLISFFEKFNLCDNIQTYEKNFDTLINKVSYKNEFDKLFQDSDKNIGIEFLIYIAKEYKFYDSQRDSFLSKLKEYLISLDSKLNELLPHEINLELDRIMTQLDSFLINLVEIPYSNILIYKKESFTAYDNNFYDKISVKNDRINLISNCLCNIEDLFLEERKRIDIEHILNAISSFQEENFFINIFKKDDVYYTSLISFLKERLLKDLYRLIYGLNLYLDIFINTKEISLKLSNIKNINFDFVISFNYTDTYRRVYDPEYNMENNPKIQKYDFIHGIAKKEYDINNCNLVLGIDEYLFDEDKDLNNNFIEFKKFFQRIYKKSDCYYLDKLNEYKNFDVETHIFGHSLDITDKDILKKMINLSSNVKIYYHDNNALGRYISNLTKIIGQDKLIKYTSGSEPKIEFIDQKSE